MKTYSGKVLFLDRADINTDDIIPAKYLTEITKEALKPYLFEDLLVDGFQADRDIAGKQVIVTRSNFGCGSSREHAPWALEVNGINLVIGESFARIFRQNMFNNGMLAVELPAATIERLFGDFAGQDTHLEVDLENGRFSLRAGGKTAEIDFTLAEFDRALVDAGGWVNYADVKY